MKRFIVMMRVLSAVMIMAMLFSLCGCGNTASQEREDTVPEAVAEETPEQGEAVIPEETDFPEKMVASEVLYTATSLELDEQNEIDQALLAEAESGYSFEDPLVVVDPYGIAPLCALIIFDTEEETGVSLTVKGHASKDDINAVFAKEKRHILPIIGLYADQETSVELRLDDGTENTVSIATDPVTGAQIKGEITVLDQKFYDYFKLTFTYNSFYTAAYDSEGDIRYFSNIAATPLTRLSNGHYIGYAGGFIQGTGASYIGIGEYDLIGRIFNQYDLPGGTHHETVELPNGNLLMSTAHDDRAVLDDRLLEVDPATGNVVWEVDLCQLLDKTDGSCLNRSDEDWFHHNSTWYDEESDSLLISGRHIDGVVCVEKSTKKLKWILGTNEGWTRTDPSLFFTPTDNDGSFEWQFAQHNVSVIPDNDNNPSTMNILLFDNGCMRGKSTREIPPVSGKDVYSRAVLYRVDTEAMTISQEWAYGKERGDSWYSSYISGAYYDPSENVYWICSGGIMHDPSTDNYDVPLGQIMQADIEKLAYLDAVDPEGELKFELKLDNNYFRVSRINPYDRQAASLDISVPGKRFVAK